MTDRVSERRRAAQLARHYRDQEGLTIAEIARRLGRAEGTVKAYLYDPIGAKAREVKARGLEGLVAKRIDSPYESGGRSGAWSKIKWRNEQELVIGGYTEPKGARACFGALLTGYYEGGELRFAGKVGTGFARRDLASIFQRFRKLIRRACPFANLPEEGRRGGRRGLTPAEMKRCTWLEPSLVCQARFAEWTRDHHLRQASFVGLREDKPAREVTRESALRLKPRANSPRME